MKTASPFSFPVSPTTAAKLDQLGLARDADLVLHLPLRWEDETRITALENTVAGVDDRLQSMDQRVTRAEQTAQTAIEGVAVALSLADPVLTGGDSFGIRVNWGHFDGHSAIGLSMMGVLDRNLFGGGETLAIGGGIGVGLADGATGGRIGLQLSWK